MKHASQPEFVDFYLPFGGKLDPDNRWVKLATLIPWDQVEESYSHSLSDSNMGAPPLSGRVAFGAMIINERLGVTDEETVEQITENPYLQCFLGYRELLRDAPFDASMMVHFRSRFAQDDYDEINAEIIPGGTNITAKHDADAEREREAETESKKADESEERQAQQTSPDTNSGKLLIDASVTPADITYPTDLKLLNAAREKAEHLIDLLHAPSSDGERSHAATARKPGKTSSAPSSSSAPESKKCVAHWAGSCAISSATYAISTNSCNAGRISADSKRMTTAACW